MKLILEQELLRYLGRPCSLFTTDVCKNMSDIMLSPSFSYSKIITLLEKHRLTQVAYANLNKCIENPKFKSVKNSIPEDFLNKLRSICFSHVIRNEYLKEQLIKVNQLLNDRGVEVINWKGPVLACQAYGDLSLRRFNDLDIWIKDSDVAKAEQILFDYGFSNYFAKSSKDTERLSYRGVYFHPVKKYMLEFDCYMFCSQAKLEYNYSDLFRKSSYISFDGNVLRTFSPAENLFFVCFHGMKHYWNRFIWLTDAIALFEATKEEVMSDLDSFYQEDIIWFSLYIGYSTFGLKIPVEIEKKVSGLNISQLNKFVYCKFSNLFAEYYRTRLVHKIIKGEQNRRRLERQIKYYRPYRILFRLMLPNQKDFNFIKLYKILYPLYFFIRPARIIKRYFSKKQAKQ